MHCSILARRKYSAVWIGTETLGLSFNLNETTRFEAIRFAMQLSHSTKSKMEIAIDNKTTLFIALIADDKRFIKLVNRSLHHKFD